MTLDAVLIESILEELIILDIFIFMLGSPFYFTECKSAGIKTVEDTAVNCPRSTLFNLCKIKLCKQISLSYFRVFDTYTKQFVEPLQNSDFAYEVGFVHHSY